MPVEETAPGTSTPPSSSASPALSPAPTSGDKLTPREKRLLARAEKAKAKDGRQAAASRKKGKEREWQPPAPPEPEDMHAEDTPLCIVYVTLSGLNDPPTTVRELTLFLRWQLPLVGTLFLPAQY